MQALAPRAVAAQRSFLDPRMLSMSAITRKFLRIVPVCLFLFPAVAAAQGTVGLLEQSFSNGFVISSARAGSLAFFTTIFPTGPAQSGSGFMRSDGTPQGTFSIDPRGPAGPLDRVRGGPGLPDPGAAHVSR
jgi:hypothetical protein